MLTRWSGSDGLSMRAEPPAHTPTVALIIIEASDRLSHARLHQLVASSLPRLARFRSRLVGKPFGVGQPVWAEIDDYDAASQLHRATVHAPGGRQELAELVAALGTGARDGSRPLWEAWSINGLANGRWALAVKTSPLLNDRGDFAASVWPRVLTSGPPDDGGPNLHPEPSLGSAPSLGELVTDAVSEIVENYVTGLWLVADAGVGALQSLRRRLRGTDRPQFARSAASSMTGPVPRTRLNPPLTRRRAVAFASVPLADAESVSNAFGGSIANVFLAACTLSLRSWLQHNGTVPDNPLLMQVPLSLYGEDPAASGKTLAVGQIRLPVQLDDPVQILTNLHTAAESLTIERRDETENDSAGIDLASIASLIPPPIARAGMQVYNALRPGRRRPPVCHGSVSYLPGSTMPTYYAGARVVGMHTAAPLVHGAGLNITAYTHTDVLDLCVSACPDNVPEVDEIALPNRSASWWRLRLRRPVAAAAQSSRR